MDLLRLFKTRHGLLGTTAFGTACLTAAFLLALK
jgi:hypothetical protein